LVLDTEHGAVNVVIADVDRVQLELLEDSPGQQQPSAVGSGVVGETDLDSVPERPGGLVRAAGWTI